MATCKPTVLPLFIYLLFLLGHELGMVKLGFRTVTYIYILMIGFNSALLYRVILRSVYRIQNGKWPWTHFGPRDEWENHKNGSPSYRQKILVVKIDRNHSSSWGNEENILRIFSRFNRQYGRKCGTADRRARHVHKSFLHVFVVLLVPTSVVKQERNVWMRTNGPSIVLFIPVAACEDGKLKQQCGIKTNSLNYWSSYKEWFTEFSRKLLNASF
jgi:hypothetical protein